MLLAVVLHISLLFLVLESLYCCVYAILNISEFSSSFLTHTSVYVISKCKSLCIIINFLVLWFICASFSLVHFKNGPAYLTKETAQVFIPLCTMAIYMNMRNVHGSLKVLRHKERGTIFLYWLFHLPPPLISCGTRHKGLREQAKVNCLVRCPVLN